MPRQLCFGAMARSCKNHVPSNFECICPRVGAQVAAKKELLRLRCEACAATLAIRPFGGFGSELLQESDISLLSPCSPRNPPFPLRCGCPLVGAHVSVKQKLLCRRCEACAATLAILSIKNFGGFGDDECICLLNPALWVAWGHF